MPILINYTPTHADAETYRELTARPLEKAIALVEKRYGTLAYHPSLTVFIARKGLPRSQALAVGEWLIARRPAIQQRLDIRNGHAREEQTEAMAA